MKMQTLVPARKVTAAAIAAACAQISIYGFEQVVAHDLPDLIEAAVTVVFVGIGGYFTPPAERDQITSGE